MEVHFRTGKHVPLVIGGIYDNRNQRLYGEFEVPGMLSFLVNRDLNSEVKGLDKFPIADRPPVGIMHYAFQTMVACGMLMLLVSLGFAAGIIKYHHWLNKPWLLRIYAVLTPIGFLAIEADWTVT